MVQRPNYSQNENRGDPRLNRVFHPHVWSKMLYKKTHTGKKGCHDTDPEVKQVRSHWTQSTLMWPKRKRLNGQKRVLNLGQREGALERQRPQKHILKK